MNINEICQLCNWNESIELFNDSNYLRPYNIKSYGGYNLFINPNCYNSIYVCYDCLINKVICCDTKKYDTLTQELKLHMVSKLIGKKWLEKLYNIDDKIGRNFIFKKIKTLKYFKH
jgi:hypothetical protein